MPEWRILFTGVEHQNTGIDVSGVSEYTVASNMVRNRIFYIEYLTIENTVSDHI